MSIENTYSIQQHLKYHCNIRKATLETPRFVSKVKLHSKQLYYCLLVIQYSQGKVTSSWNHSHHQQNATTTSMKKLVLCPIRIKLFKCKLNRHQYQLSVEFTRVNNYCWYNVSTQAGFIVHIILLYVYT